MSRAADWNYLVTERAAIVEHDGGIPEPQARRMAWEDTTRTFGPSPVMAGPVAGGNGGTVGVVAETIQKRSWGKSGGVA